jgi:hypothetical protein
MLIFGAAVEASTDDRLFMAGPSGPARLLLRFLFRLYGRRPAKQENPAKGAQFLRVIGISRIGLEARKPHRRLHPVWNGKKPRADASNKLPAEIFKIPSV